MDPQHIRNFSVIAHIDHGKSTLADRFLEITGALQAREMEAQVLDAMDLERERGITIKAHPVCLHYTAKDGQKYVLNLIDTPGHVDFTVEVERSLRVLDGAVAVFDGKEGVEAQSETVWRQATKYKVPRIAFVNKMDRTGANFENALNDMRKKLGAYAYPIFLPIGKEDHFEGVIDLVNQKAIDQLPPDLKALYPYDDIAGFFQRAPFAQVPPLAKSGDLMTIKDWIAAGEDGNQA